MKKMVLFTLILLFIAVNNAMDKSPIKMVPSTPKKPVITREENDGNYSSEDDESVIDELGYLQLDSNEKKLGIAATRLSPGSRRNNLTVSLKRKTDSRPNAKKKLQF